MNDQANPTLDPSLDLRQTLGCFPTGVTVVTCLGKSGQPLGLTVSSFNSVSLAPPLILWSLQNRSVHLNEYMDAERFAVNVLCAEQADACRTFASDVEDRFAGIDWHMSDFGLPILDNCAATLQCARDSVHPAGDHTIFIGQVLAHGNSERTPMIWGKGQLTAFPTQETSIQET